MSDWDEDERPVRRRLYIATDTQRIEIGREHRKNDGTSSESRRSQQRRSAVVAVPQPPIDDEITSPHDLLDRDLSQSQIEIIRNTRREGNDPATYADIVKLTDALYRARKQEKSNNVERDQQLATLLGSKPGDLMARFQAMESSVKSHNRLVKWGFGLALGSLISVGTFLYTRGLNEGSTATRINYIERDVDRLREAYSALTRHSDNGAASAPIAITTKDTP